ncbi:MAG: hypothetical protein K9M54_07780 [Kiritimatiellales bacterium]|nr:hypothetical protein [Kiritimatiellales bacterium]
MKINVLNCNNINQGSIEIRENRLNIKYAMNGTGKSTIAKAIYLSSTGGDLKSLKSFDRTYYLVRLPVHPRAEAIDQVTPQVAPQVTPQVRALLDVIINEMDRESLQQALGLKARKNFRLLYLTPALDAGYIEMTEPNSPKSPTQKYRLTEKGMELICPKP